MRLRYPDVCTWTAYLYWTDTAFVSILDAALILLSYDAQIHHLTYHTCTDTVRYGYGYRIWTDSRDTVRHIWIRLFYPEEEEEEREEEKKCARAHTQRNRWNTTQNVPGLNQARPGPSRIRPEQGSCPGPTQSESLPSPKAFTATMKADDTCPQHYMDTFFIVFLFFHFLSPSRIGKYRSEVLVLRTCELGWEKEDGKHSCCLNLDCWQL